jgi:hypothetical protein
VVKVRVVVNPTGYSFCQSNAVIWSRRLFVEKRQRLMALLLMMGTSAHCLLTGSKSFVDTPLGIYLKRL